MTYRVNRAFEGAGTAHRPGSFITDPTWPASNLKALISQRYITVCDPPKEEVTDSKPTKRGRT